MNVLFASCSCSGFSIRSYRLTSSNASAIELAPAKYAATMPVAANPRWNANGLARATDSLQTLSSRGVWLTHVGSSESSYAELELRLAVDAVGWGSTTGGDND